MTEPGRGTRRPPRPNHGAPLTKTEYRSDCKHCHTGIYGSDGVWNRKPLGLVHKTCATEETPK